MLAENTGVKVLGSHSMARTQSWRDDVRNGMQALILQNKGKIKGIWASFDGQAYIIDDLLRAQGFKKGDVKLVSVDGGAETYRRIADPESTVLATVAIPFEEMGKAAVDAIDTHRGAEEAEGVGDRGPVSLHGRGAGRRIERGAVRTSDRRLSVAARHRQALRRGRGADAASISTSRRATCSASAATTAPASRR